MSEIIAVYQALPSTEMQGIWDKFQTLVWLLLLFYQGEVGQLEQPGLVEWGWN